MERRKIELRDTVEREKREQRAETLLRSARNLEKAGKPAGALGLYRQLFKDFPATPAAKAAAERITALGEK